MVNGTARSTIILKIDDDVCQACRRCLGARACETTWVFVTRHEMSLSAAARTQYPFFVVYNT